MHASIRPSIRHPFTHCRDVRTSICKFMCRLAHCFCWCCCVGWLLLLCWFMKLRLCRWSRWPRAASLEDIPGIKSDDSYDITISSLSINLNLLLFLGEKWVILNICWTFFNGFSEKPRSGSSSQHNFLIPRLMKSHPIDGGLLVRTCRNVSRHISIHLTSAGAFLFAGPTEWSEAGNSKQLAARDKLTAGTYKRTEAMSYSEKRLEALSDCIYIYIYI